MATRRNTNRHQPPPPPRLPAAHADNIPRLIPPKPGSLSVLARLGLPTNPTGSASSALTSLDKDGDMMMVSTSQPSSPAPRYTPYGKRGIRRINRAPNTQVPNDPQSPVAVALTLQSIEPEDDLLKFIRSKVDAEVLLSDMRYEGNTLYFHVRSLSDLHTLRRLNGTRFRANKLSFRQVQSINPILSAPAPPGQHIIILAQVVQSRYDPDRSFLDLSSIDTDPVVIQAGLAEQRAESSKMWPVICKLIGEFCPQVPTISFASNKFRSLQPVSTLREFVPNVCALSFENNPLDKFRDLEPIRGADLKSLREVVFLDTPLRTRELAIANGDLRYRSKITALFPSITMLDQQPILAEISFDLPDTVAAPLPIKPGFFDSDNTKQAAHHFLQTFYNLYDNNRDALISLYDDSASFSYAIDDSKPRSVGPLQKKRPDNWAAWQSCQRNLHKLKDPVRRVNSIYFGAAAIHPVLLSLPQTKHDSTNWVVDAFQRPDPVMLFVTVHGEFEEVSTRSKRSLHRTFVVIPSAPGSSPAMAGFPYAIMNDQWTVRTWKPIPRQLSQQATAS
ncbi:hypothetical protein SeLEV6574_g07079 [Synchytrium endobioticum]|uniref:NTF2 domain-containing protein n=1 Tax=Synchytrium endobioticum TaxID=286115 RepID=A0A507CMB1_9FUNG|nr:hypothetical protein SeLEV6574_g07079 [Synchytrium endobioticum]